MKSEGNDAVVVAAVIFDLDGTLIDYETLSHDALANPLVDRYLLIDNYYYKKNEIQFRSNFRHLFLGVILCTSCQIRFEN